MPILDVNIRPFDLYAEITKILQFYFVFCVYSIVTRTVEIRTKLTRFFLSFLKEYTFYQYILLLAYW